MVQGGSEYGPLWVLLINYPDLRESRQFSSLMDNVIPPICFLLRLDRCNCHAWVFLINGTLGITASL